MRRVLDGVDLVGAVVRVYVDTGDDVGVERAVRGARGVVDHRGSVLERGIGGVRVRHRGVVLDRVRHLVRSLDAVVDRRRGVVDRLAETTDHADSVADRLARATDDERTGHAGEERSAGAANHRRNRVRNRGGVRLDNVRRRLGDRALILAQGVRRLRELLGD